MLENPICFVLGHGILDPHKHTARTHCVGSCSAALYRCDYMVTAADNETDCGGLDVRTFKDTRCVGAWYLMSSRSDFQPSHNLVD